MNFFKELADQNAICELSLAPYVDRVLKALGHPEALVTDKSTIGDFLEWGGRPYRVRRGREGAWELRQGDLEVKARNDALLANIARQLGVPVEHGDLIVSMAHRVRTREQILC